MIQTAFSLYILVLLWSQANPYPQAAIVKEWKMEPLVRQKSSNTDVWENQRTRFYKSNETKTQNPEKSETKPLNGEVTFENLKGLHSKIQTQTKEINPPSQSTTTQRNNSKSEGTELLQEFKFSEKQNDTSKYSNNKKSTELVQHIKTYPSKNYTTSLHIKNENITQIVQQSPTHSAKNNTTSPQNSTNGGNTTPSLKQANINPVKKNTTIAQNRTNGTSEVWELKTPLVPQNGTERKKVILGTQLKNSQTKQTTSPQGSSTDQKNSQTEPEPQLKFSRFIGGLLMSKKPANNFIKIYKRKKGHPFAHSFDNNKSVRMRNSRKGIQKYFKKEVPEQTPVVFSYNYFSEKNIAEEYN